MDDYNVFIDGDVFTSPMPTEFGSFKPGLLQTLKAIDYPFEYQVLPTKDVLDGTYNNGLRPTDLATISTAATLFLDAFGIKAHSRDLRIMAGTYSQHTPNVFDDDFHIDSHGTHQTPTFVAIVSVGPTTNVMNGQACSEDFGETIEAQNAKVIRLKEGVFNLLDPLTVHRRPDKPAAPVNRLAIDYRSYQIDLRAT
jgi:hypothetical protein